MGDLSNIIKKNPTLTLSKSGWERGTGVHNGLNKNRSLRSSQRQAASAGLKIFNNTVPL